jgi:glycosyltransferase involved in cell wall biosynthesis
LIFVQAFIDRAYLAYQRLRDLPAARRREAVRWDRVPPVSAGVRVFYGLEEMPGSDGPVTGGIVKTLDLQSLYPNTPRGGNLLYLVSSALPPFAELMVKQARAHGVGVVWNQNGVAYPAWFGPGWNRENATMRKLIHQADYVFFQSDFCRQSAEKYLGRVGGPHEILHNAVDTRVFCPAAERPLRLRLLLAGSHHHGYRVSTALEAVARVKVLYPEIRLEIAGRYLWRRNEAEALSEAQAKADELGLGACVEFTGAYTQEEAVLLMQRCHILLHTKYNDPCPRVVVEALACGLPVVYSSSGGVPELVGSDAGVGVPAPLDWDRDHPPDPEQLSTALQTVIDQRDAMSRAARLRALEGLDVEGWVARHGSVFSEWAGPRSS